MRWTLKEIMVNSQIEWSLISNLNGDDVSKKPILRIISITSNTYFKPGI
jgi:hypothetical protein